MNYNAKKISYAATNSFSSLVVDYISNADELKPFYRFQPNIEGIEQALINRKNYHTDRNALTNHLQQQYNGFNVSTVVAKNIAALKEENTFTVCTAHQPNIFTGHLYFIYKILHAITLAEQLNKTISQYKFVPVYYMGNEDADLNELGEVSINGHKYRWHTKQTGAVGKMKVDAGLINIISGISGQLLPDPNGEAVVELIKQCYKDGESIEQATFRLVNELFGKYGLICLIPDSASLKALFLPIAKKEIENNFSSATVGATIAAFPEKYNAQPLGREINLFYLTEGIRNRIEQSGEIFKIVGTDLVFSKQELINHFEKHPERLSPNVVLRPLYQESILPNVAFIGGGGEMAYWLKLLSTFEQAGVYFPALIIRNSFLVIPKELSAQMHELNIGTNNIFEPISSITNKFLLANSYNKLELTAEQQTLAELYESIEKTAGKADSTLSIHVRALHQKALNKLLQLEKKMMAAERKKNAVQLTRLTKLKNSLFPSGTLQERIENILPYLSRNGFSFIDELQKASNTTEQTFTILTEE